jgi:hypothetical protein
MPIADQSLRIYKPPSEQSGMQQVAFSVVLRLAVVPSIEQDMECRAIFGAFLTAALLTGGVLVGSE